MTERYDLVIRDTRILGSDLSRKYDVAVEGGIIAEVSQRIRGRGEVELIADGGLITPPFANPHLHACKVYTFLMLGEEAVREYQSLGNGWGDGRHRNSV